MEEPESCNKSKTVIKLSKIRTADSTVLKHITWPHELVYGAGSHPTVYEKLTLPLFISRYLTILETMKPAQKVAMLKYLPELMTDTEIYRWEPVHAFHAVWLL